METRYLIIVLVISLIVGFISAFIARRKNKSPLLWFFIGFILNVIVILVVLYYWRDSSGNSKRK
jgi:LytS/YehU family sensor histidine kinase